MNILYVWDADYPWDIRVEKICQSLIRAGHDVHIAARNLRRRPRHEIIDGMSVHRLPALPTGILNYGLSFPAFFNPLWRTLLDQVIRRHSIDLIIVRDLPMAIAGVWAGKRHGCPVMFDMAEDYVSMLRAVWQYKRFNPLNLFVRNPHLARLVERYTMPRVDHVLVVVEEAIDVVRRAGGDDRRVTVVGNSPRLDQYQTRVTPAVGTVTAEMQQRFTAIYTGSVIGERGLATVLDAIPFIVRDIPDFLFVAIGDGYQLPDLKKTARAKGVEEHVRWLGWIDHTEMLGYIQLARIGLIADFPSDHTNTTIPNKLFDYMAFGLPVVTGNTVPMTRVVDATNCGVTFEGGNAQDLARAIVEVQGSTTNFGMNGRRAVQETYHWANDERKLLAAIARVGTTATPIPLERKVAGL